MKRIRMVTLGVAAAVGLATVASGQDNSGPQNPAPAQNAAPGWHRFGERAPDAGDSSSVAPQETAPQNAAPQDTAPQVQAPRQQYPGPSSRQYPLPPSQRDPLPSSLTVPAGTWITVRMNQGLSSDRNQAGDAFTASLAEPIVAQGLVIARRGQTIGGRVSQAEKAGRVKGTSNLGVELTELSLVDGQQLPVKTQFISRRGDTSVGRDVGAVGVTTGLGAAIGAAAGGGWGAGIGALAGAAVGTTGVLATRGQPTIIYPETVLTFRLEQPVTVTSQAMQAFQPAGQEEYNRQDYNRPAMRSNAPRPGYGTPYEQGAYPYYPYYPSTGFYFYSGPGFFYGRGFYGRRRW
jgi:hypothetical protein